MPKREDAPVQGNQTATRNSPLDEPSAESQGSQLPPRHYAVLALGQLPNDRSRFIPRRNALSTRQGDNTLHFGSVLARWIGCNALSTREGDKALHPGWGDRGLRGGVAWHWPNVAKGGARGAR